MDNRCLPCVFNNNGNSCAARVTGRRFMVCATRYQNAYSEERKKVRIFRTSAELHANLIIVISAGGNIIEIYSIGRCVIIKSSEHMIRARKIVHEY